MRDVIGCEDMAEIGYANRWVVKWIMKMASAQIVETSVSIIREE